MPPYDRGVPHPEIIYRDEHLIALNKPAGLLSVPGIGSGRQDCVAARIQREWPKARIVHRLDRDTSGVMVMALDADTHRELSRMFHDREVRKKYIAIVAGIVAQEEGAIDLPMRKDLEAAKATGIPRHIIDHQQGRPALTRWQRLLPSPSGTGVGGEGDRTQPIATTRLELTPVTGRSHQLRVHLAAIGHPILGDDIYAPPQVRDAAPRLLLHAESLELPDPWSAIPRRFTAACPF